MIADIAAMYLEFFHLSLAFCVLLNKVHKDNVVSFVGENIIEYLAKV
jgi:hypothetical protein